MVGSSLRPFYRYLIVPGLAMLRLSRMSSLTSRTIVLLSLAPMDLISTTRLQLPYSLMILLFRNFSNSLQFQIWHKDILSMLSSTRLRCLTSISLHRWSRPCRPSMEAFPLRNSISWKMDRLESLRLEVSQTSTTLASSTTCYKVY